VQTVQEKCIEKLYRYEILNLNHLEDILIHSRVHVSNVANVNDPWDCRPWFEKGDLSDPCRREQWARFFRTSNACSSLELKGKIATLLPAWTDNERLLSESIYALIEHVRENTVKRWRLYCLTTHPDSILMWSHYADKHRGICLEFDTGNDVLGSAQMVAYRELFDVISPEALLGDGDALAKTILLTKSSHWQCEDEYRMLTRDAGLDQTFPLISEDDYLSLPSSALTAVIAGCNCSDSSLVAIQELLKNHAPRLTLKRAALVPHKYGVSIAA
jgi:hypothetical protein